MDALTALGPSWTGLWAFRAKRIAHLLEQPDNGDLDGDTLLSFELGISLLEPGAAPDFRYDETPHGSFTFARTGVDGEHFGVLLDGAAAGLVVLTAPMGDEPNHVVGESLAEFLDLGCVGGYGSIANLAYVDQPRAIAAIEEPPTTSDGSFGTDAAQCLAELRSQLGLAPWPDIASRLTQLAARWP